MLPSTNKNYLFRIFIFILTGDVRTWTKVCDIISIINVIFVDISKITLFYITVRVHLLTHAQRNIRMNFKLLDSSFAKCKNTWNKILESIFSQLDPVRDSREFSLQIHTVNCTGRKDSRYKI